MFGCGLPVCALDFAWFVFCLYFISFICYLYFPSLHELVKDKVNGLIFRTAEELASHFEVSGVSYTHKYLLRVNSLSWKVFRLLQPCQN